MAVQNQSKLPLCFRGQLAGLVLETLTRSNQLQPCKVPMLTTHIIFRSAGNDDVYQAI